MNLSLDEKLKRWTDRQKDKSEKKSEEIIEYLEKLKLYVQEINESLYEIKIVVNDTTYQFNFINEFALIDFIKLLNSNTLEDYSQIAFNVKSNDKLLNFTQIKDLKSEFIVPEAEPPPTNVFALELFPGDMPSIGGQKIPVLGAVCPFCNIETVVDAMGSIDLQEVILRKPNITMRCCSKKFKYVDVDRKNNKFKYSLIN